MFVTVYPGFLALVDFWRPDGVKHDGMCEIVTGVYICGFEAGCAEQAVHRSPHKRSSRVSTFPQPNTLQTWGSLSSGSCSRLVSIRSFDDERPLIC